MYTTEQNKIYVPISELDVRATLECGQLFRFEKTDGHYTVKSGEHVCTIETTDDNVVITTPSVGFFVNFFDLERDIGRIKRELARFPELIAPIECCGSLRILHQPLFETIISFIISANNNIPRIKTIINRLCATNADVFPSPAQIAEMPIRMLDALGCGYRSQYIQTSAKICAETDILDRLKFAPTPEAQQLLISLPGVGQKIADCVSLFALGRFEVFPVDTWIIKTLRVGNETETRLRARLMETYGMNAGYAQQLIYYYNAILRMKG
ncbi:MAG: hypothetical protein OSJ83_00905 [Clostridia bacterium]|nr:hypothetical protein [Clostridia bacterium]